MLRIFRESGFRRITYKLNNKRSDYFSGMIRLFAILFFLAPLISFSQGFKVSIELTNSTDTVAYLGHHFATNRYVDDTASVTNGKVEFSGSNSLTEGIYFYYSGSTYFEFLLVDQKLTIRANAKDVPGTIQFVSSDVNEGFYKLQNFTSERRAKSAELQNQIKNETDQTKKEQITQELKDLNEEVLEFQAQIRETYSNTLLDRMVRVMQNPEVPENPDIEDQELYNYLYYKNHFWDGIDIADPGLLRTPLLDPKVTDYLDNVVIQHPDSVIEAVDVIMQSASKNSETFRYLLITLTNKYETSPLMGFDKVFVHLVENYYLNNKPEWVDAETLQKLSDRIASIKPNFIGNPAPPLNLWDTLGTEVKLQDIKAQFTVLYFYDPDCGHCKTKTPLLYANYPELQSRDVEILAICTTTDEQRWLEFIKEHDLNWINLADLQAKTYFKFYYDVRSTPTVYILDKDKKILVKKIDAEQILPIIDDLIARGD